MNAALIIVGSEAHRLRHGDSIARAEAVRQLLELTRRAIRGASACDMVLMLFKASHGSCDGVAWTRFGQGSTLHSRLGRHRVRTKSTLSQLERDNPSRGILFQC